MSRGTLITAPMRSFVDYFGELGPRWGLGANTCRLHAYLYLVGRPVSEDDLQRTLGIDDEAFRHALADLSDWRMARKEEGNTWDASGDPWELLLAGLEQRRQRELGPVQDMLRNCIAQVRSDKETPRGVTARIASMLALVEDLSAIQVQARRLSPEMLRQLVGFGGGAARILDRALPRRRRER